MHILFDCRLSIKVVVRLFIGTQNRLVALHSDLIVGSRRGGQQPAQCNLSINWIDKEVYRALLLDYSRLWFNGGRFCVRVSGHMTTYRNDTKTGLETQSNWLWCAGLCVGADRTADVSTRRSGSECSLPWHVWIDSRTSVKCVKDARCIEGSCAHLIRLQTCYTGISC